MSKLYLFHEFTLDSKNWSLYRGTDIVELSPKMIDVLTYMVAHAGEVVSHEDMMRNVWPGSIVDHGTLKHAIFTIRTALGDDCPTTGERRVRDASRWFRYQLFFGGFAQHPGNTGLYPALSERR